MTGHHSWHTSLIKAVIGSAQVQGDGEIGTLSEFVAIFPVYNLCLLISRKGEAANWELGWDQDGGGTRDSIRYILAVVAPQVSFTSLKFHSVCCPISNSAWFSIINISWKLAFFPHFKLFLFRNHIYCIPQGILSFIFGFLSLLDL